METSRKAQAIIDRLAIPPKQTCPTAEAAFLPQRSKICQSSAKAPASSPPVIRASRGSEAERARQGDKSDLTCALGVFAPYSASLCLISTMIRLAFSRAWRSR